MVVIIRAEIITAAWWASVLECVGAITRVNRVVLCGDVELCIVPIPAIVVVEIAGEH